MEPGSPYLNLRRSSSSGSLFKLWKYEKLLPSPASAEKAMLRPGSMFGNSLYRRVLIWTVLCIMLVSLAMLRSRDVSATDDLIPQWSLVGEQPVAEGANVGGQGDDPDMVVVVVDENGELVTDEINDEEKKEGEDTEEEDEIPEIERMVWLRFPHLNGYYHGLRSLVSKAEHVPEYPNITKPAPFDTPPKTDEVPVKQRPYSPHHADRKPKTCYIDKTNRIPAPDMYAYDGVVQNMPDPAIGSYELLGIRDDVCFDRFGRFGPYGLGYKKTAGGSDVGVETEDSHAGDVWARTGQINYGEVSWGDVQDRCNDANKHRFKQIDVETDELEKSATKMGRIAVVVRLYTEFKWTDHAVLNFRAMINELALKSGGEYTVHFLLHVRDIDTPVWADDQVVEKVLRENVPAEFHSLVSIWSEPQMKLYYPGDFDDAISDPSGGDIHGSYRSAHFPLQVFAAQHPEYEHIWNWEMDMRWTGNYYELFDRMASFAADQPRQQLWERNERYYIPSFHGSWENFTQAVANDTARSGKKAVFGPTHFPGRKPLRFEQAGGKPMPDGCEPGHDRTECGVGEQADLITLNPLFDADESGWVFGLDVTGYGDNENPPRRCAIVTASRMSRRLLMSMHEEVWRNHHTMFSEMFPASVALHHGFKAVYAPHPVYLDRAWYPSSEIDAAFNGGSYHSTSGDGSPFDVLNEHNHKGSSWYYNSEFAGLLWRRWLGYSQLDGRSDNGGRPDEGHLRGGPKEEASPEGSGRMCLRGMLLHPIKFENPAERHMS